MRANKKARSRNAEAAEHRSLWAFLERQLDGIDFAGKSVLDIGVVEHTLEAAT